VLAIRLKLARNGITIVSAFGGVERIDRDRGGGATPAIATNAARNGRYMETPGGFSMARPPPIA